MHHNTASVNLLQNVQSISRKLPLVCALSNRKELVHYWGDGSGAFTQGDTLPAPNGGKLDGIAAADFSGDGIADLAAYVSVSGVKHISIYLGQAGGNLAWKQDLANLTGSHMGPEAIDFDRDGKLDLVSRRDPHTLVILLGAGDGTFSEAAQHTDAGVNLGEIGVGDFDGDMWPDIAVGIYIDGTDKVLILVNTSVVAVPALSQWGGVVLVLALAGVACVRLKRTRAAA